MKLSTEAKITIFTAFLAFFGALIGTFLGNYYDKNQWKREVDYSERKSILDKRIDLIDKTTRILNRTEYAKVLLAQIEYWSNENDSGRVRALANVQRDKDKKPLLPYKDKSKEVLLGISKSKTALIELNSDFASLMQLNALYFGTETREAVKELITDGKWWNIDKEEGELLLKAMHSELQI